MLERIDSRTIYTVTRLTAVGATGTALALMAPRGRGQIDYRDPASFLLGRTAMVEAASCTAEGSFTVYNFTNVGGDPNEYDQGDIRREPVSRATIVYLINDKPVIMDGKPLTGSTNDGGKATNRILADCVPLDDGKPGIKFTVRITQGTRQVDYPIRGTISLHQREGQKFTAYLLQDNATTVPAASTRKPDNTPTSAPATATGRPTTAAGTTTPEATRPGAPTPTTAPAPSASPRPSATPGSGGAGATEFQMSLNPLNWPGIIKWPGGIVLGITSAFGLLGGATYQRRKNRWMADPNVTAYRADVEAAVAAGDPIPVPPAGLPAKPKWFYLI